VIRALCLTLALGAILAPAVAAHGDGGARGYRSKVTVVTPAVAGMSVRVLDFDDRLQLSNRTGESIEILGYNDEPYLRFTPDGVFRNARSPATYLNDDRYARVEVPAEADPDAPPRWERVASDGSFDWHDHRIHWMSTVDPPRVRNAPDDPHHVFDWTVPATIGGRSLEINGSLDYLPPDGGRPPLALLVLPFAGFGVIVGFVLWRRRRRARVARG
jgi:hypothetical protein